MPRFALHAAGIEGAEWRLLARKFISCGDCAKLSLTTWRRCDDSPETLGGTPCDTISGRLLAAYTDADGKFTGDFGDEFANRAAFISFVSDALAI